METKQIKVGDYIRGFKYNCPKDLVERMNSHVGKIAKVITTPEDYTIKVEFSDGQTWWYPKPLAIEHLCNDPLKPLDTLVIDKTIAEMLQHPENFMKDNINPDHYKSKSKETIERLQDNLTQGEFKGYLKGNILKYLDRYEHKNGVEDLNKAQWYLNKLIELES